MGRLIYYVALLLTWSPCLHAQEQGLDHLPNEPHSALPWLSLDSLSATRERPLFAPDRRKPAPPPPVGSNRPEALPQAQAPQKPQLRLTGVIVSPWETLVLLRNPATSESVTIHPGETFGRWHVLVESNDTVTLKDGAEEITLEMFAGP